MNVENNLVSPADLKVLQGIDINTLMALGHKEGDEFDTVLGTSEQFSALSDALRDALAAEQKEKLARCAKEILALFQAADKSTAHSVAAIRNARAVERAHLKRVKDIQLTMQYAKETTDMKPLISAIFGNNMHTVPVSWKSKTSKSASAPAKTAIGKK